MCVLTQPSRSIFNGPLTRELGGVVCAATDWSLASTVPVFSTCIVFLGMSACLTGKWLETVGPRCAATVSAVCWGSGHLLAAAGVAAHSLPLLVIGYGVLGGVGLGLGYVAPVSNLIRWFPDRRGMAAGMAVAGFGGGPLVAGPLNNFLLSKYFIPPTYLGPAESVALVTQDGLRLAPVGEENQLVEVVVATTRDLVSACPAGLTPDMLLLQEGVYVVGTGSSGVAATFLTLGALYSTVILASAFSFRVPAPGWSPVTATTNEVALEEPCKTETCTVEGDVHIDDAIKTPQFYLLWTVLGLNVTAGIGIVACASTMMRDIFSGALPATVDASFCATYVGAIGIANIVGRLGWASLSDIIGRRAAFNVYFGLGAPLYLSLPLAAHAVSAAPSVVPLLVFYSSSMLIFSMYGAGFATIPAYLADKFGTKYVGGIHARLLTAWSCAGVVGPSLLTYLREVSNEQALRTLASQVDPQAFTAAFGAGPESLQALITAKSVTISHLLDLLPAGTVDPTPFLYDSTCHSMAGLLVIAFIANNLVRPVSPKWWMVNRPDRLEVKPLEKTTGSLDRIGNSMQDAGFPKIGNSLGVPS
eukprot:gene7424-1326_t